MARELLSPVSRTARVKRERADAEIERIARDLEHYVSLHPTAADTAEGIARWWLPYSDEPALNLVEAALEQLVQRGIVARKSLPGGTFIFASAAPTRGHAPN
jgi:hypothetical protein